MCHSTKFGACCSKHSRPAAMAVLSTLTEPGRGLQIKRTQAMILACYASTNDGCNELCRKCAEFEANGNTQLGSIIRDALAEGVNLQRQRLLSAA